MAISKCPAQISATYRGANEYRPDYFPAQGHAGKIEPRPNSGYVNYINYSSFLIPPYKDALGLF